MFEVSYVKFTSKYFFELITECNNNQSIVVNRKPPLQEQPIAGKVYAYTVTISHVVESIDSE